MAISFHGIIRRTNARGYATFVVVLRRPGRYPAFARQRGYLPGKTVVIVHRPRRRK